MASTGSGWPAALAALLLALPFGLLLGWFSWWADRLVFDGRIDANAILAGLGNAPTLWILAAFSIGVVARQMLAGALAGLLLLAVATVAYYVLHQTIGDRTWLPQRSAAEAWLIVALFVGPLFGAAGAAWRTGTPLQVPAASLVCGAIAGCGVFILQEPSGAWARDDSRALLAAAHIATGFLLAPIMLRDWRQRAAAVLLVALGGIVSAAAIAITLDLVRDAIA